MKIQQLEQREPFGAIVTKTLKRHFDRQCAANFDVRWYSRHDWKSASLQSGTQLWFCRPELNVIFPGRIAYRRLKEGCREFNHSAAAWRAPFQRLYLRTTLHPLFASHLAPAVMSVYPSLAGAEAMLILGGNNRLRILNVETGQLEFILKDGFDPQLIETEIEIRKRIKSSHIPDVLSVAADGRSFSERYIRGIALSRIVEARRLHWEDAAFRILSEISSCAMEEMVEPIQYCASLAQSIGSHLRAHGDLSAATEAGKAVEAALEIIDSLSQDSGQRLNLRLSHGDFQPGNILVEGEHIWITDWEYAAVRQRDYDVLVYVLATRNGASLAERVRGVLLYYTNQMQPPARLRPMLGCSPDHLRLILGVFVIEEFLWRIRNKINRVFTDWRMTMDTLTFDMKEALTALHGSVPLKKRCGC